MCLVCQQTLINETMKPAHLKYHFDTKHSDKKTNYCHIFYNLRPLPKKQKTMNTMFTEENDGMIASYNIAILVAKTGKSDTIGEILLQPVIKDVLSTVMHKNSGTIVNKIPLSKDTVSRRIDEIVTDVKHQLIQN